MRIIILSILILLNAVSMIEMGQYFDSGFIQLLSVRIILAVISLILSIVYLLVGGTKALKLTGIVTALIALSHLVFMLYINL
ncbi:MULTISPECIES: hypothetical protein [Salinicoccus]|uniref:Uncharacterized protein n=2 Tax=Salinicoccus TaxID=45669 RepID=A0A285UK97_9STAP|nr:MULTISPECIES: hypothetical protein [Salinicoccus]MCD2138464.1 hypothetical protein [Salinicoccus halitifaciens]SOC42193.1 hypothetical protein SAMN05878391_1556 [Salinicoccus kekensis]